ncbi:YkyB family protein [Bacillaceae bacterium IKA-2]|nr:YkyB family protein [Bacillaceae bacterium IKA-2]
MEKSNSSNFDNEMESIKHALYSVNRHVKTAIDKRELYDLKSKTLQKLLKVGHAEKMWLEYSSNPGKSKQSTVVLLKVGTKTKGEPHFFHMLPEKDDYSSLKHKGVVSTQDLHNPKSNMSLKIAKEILLKFIGVDIKKAHVKKAPRQALNKRIFVSSFLDGNSRPRN